MANNTPKINLHPRNKHRLGYDFESLIKKYPPLKNFIFKNKYEKQTVDFANPEAIIALNKSLLLHDYKIIDWDIPTNYLCPPIPGRADYIHYIADLLGTNNNNSIPKGKNIQGLDIGTGANCIYPILGNSIYGWSFVGTDIDEKALQNCKKIISKNPFLIESISLQQQIEPRSIFKNILTNQDKFAFTMCNPPFHSSIEEASKANLRKLNNLQIKKTTEPKLNFGGQTTELWCQGGEKQFVTQMIYESAKYSKNCLWYTTLVSKEDYLKHFLNTSKKVNVAKTKIIEMSQGQKKSRIFAWTFWDDSQQKQWKF